MKTERFYEPGDGGRTRIGNTPTCEDCGESVDACTCEDETSALIMCSICGTAPALCGFGTKGYCANCKNPADVAKLIFATPDPWAVARARAQLSLF